MTTNRFTGGYIFDCRINIMIPQPKYLHTNYRFNFNFNNNISMMTRYYPRKNLPRISHLQSIFRDTNRYNFIYYIRNLFFLCLLLSILSQKTSPKHRNWGLLTSYVYQSFKSFPSTFTKYSYSISLWGYSYMSPPLINIR